uniref:DEK_C domain-containing protein n=1 Tax=Ascaris lumbricoides TaxID=6252 RepID=A0A0M3ITS6_ASCLU
MVLYFGEINPTKDNEFPSVEFPSVDDIDEDDIETTTIIDSTKSEDMLDMPPPLLNIESTSTSVSSSTSLHDYEDSQTSYIFSTQSSISTSAPFPTPISSFDILMRKAKKFADEYLSKGQQHELHIAVVNARATGADRDEIRRVVLRFLNSALTTQQKKHISARKEELNYEFSDEAVLRSQ